MSKWKLYWVASDGLEDCFVVAKNSKSAAKIEKDMNGFDSDELSVTRIMDIPDQYEDIANEKFREWSKKHHCNQHLDQETLVAWPYYAGDWLLEALGVRYRIIKEKKEILINDTVITDESIYPIGIKAMKQIAELTGEKFPYSENVSYEGMRAVIDQMLGICITTIHKIENLLTNSFVFAVGNKKYADYTISSATELWKEKFTFGRLINLIKERYIIDETIDNALQLFLIQRNKIAHGLTKDDRFDIDTIWGQKEIIGYIALFLRNAWVLEEVVESAYIVTIGVGFSIMKKEEVTDSDLIKSIEQYENDPYVREKVALFSEVFKVKD
ncbi:MAG: hypothetical protein LBN26_08790 [Christensenellaceae bacterium]|jgi:hypothetical protein|nr:hypothetical protein [Christensenellaceae bacterium]